MIRIQSEPFDPALELAALAERAPAAGAIASFVGLVRPSAGDTQVDQLDLEHFGEFTRATVEAIAADGSARFELLDLTIVPPLRLARPGRSDRVRRRRRRAPPRGV